MDNPLAKEQAASYFVRCLKLLLEIAEEEAPFLKEEMAEDKQRSKLKQKFHESDSSDSKYSNEDRKDKDHLLTGEDALRRSLKKLKHANKIVQKNKLLGKDKNTSHVVSYYNEINNKMIAPRALGMVHRKSNVTQINLK